MIKSDVISDFIGTFPAMKITEPYSPSARANASAKPVKSAGKSDGRTDAAKRQPARRAEARGGLFLFALEVLEHRLHRAHDKRQADERQRDQHAQRRERHLDAERREILPDPSVARVHGRERNTGNRCWQHKRQIDDCIDDPFERKRVAHQHSRDQKAEHGVDDRTAERRAERQFVRRQHARRRGRR